MYNVNKAENDFTTISFNIVVTLSLLNICHDKGAHGTISLVVMVIVKDQGQHVDDLCSN